MGSRICMNASCGTATTHEWKRGWPLRSGGYADLCYNCGSAYENFVFCNTFHLEEPGWRECYLCRKRLHCGCIASKSLLELLDYGGVGCTSCSMSSRLHAMQRDEIRNEFVALTINDADNLRSKSVEKTVVGNGADEGKLTQLCRIMEANEPNFLPSQIGDTSVSIGQDKREEVRTPFGEVGTGFSSATQPSVGSSKLANPDSRSMLDIRDMHESHAHPSLSMSLGVPSGSTNFVLPFSNGTADGREQSKVPSLFQQGQRSRPILPKPPKTGLSISPETSKGAASQLRIARPPVEGRGKNHLLPRYWPRITDQELQQLSGDLNSTIVPLFEKVLSASDAGRIGRLVLPKACAEAYFPHISQSEGLPLRIQDVKGKEWVFQFRFWPNNNSRMYVLEGVTPCIQSMQLRAGDTITFSRIDPGGKLIMGFRKATNSEEMQDAQTSALPNGAPSGESSVSGVTENLPTVSGYSGLFKTLKGSKEPHMNALPEQLSLVDGDIGWHKSDNHESITKEESPQQSVPNSEKKRTRNIGSKSKRLLMHSEEALELRLTWEEAQDLLRPPPSVKPSIVTIEDHEFEEYDEPPVFGKRTIFTARPSGGQEQWAQCDDCSKWRKLPMDVLLPPKWTCSDNVWDSIRCSCSAPEEMSQKELENLLRVGRDSKKRKIVESNPAQEREPSGLDALASAAVLGDNAGDLGEPSVGVTTKHPRHRPGCTCIVCIQPPSGKGKHKPTCTCNVCMTVKRRFKTLMLRKKRRQSEREAAELAQKDHNDDKGESETNNSTTRNESMQMSHSENEMNQKRSQGEVGESSSGQIDLNCDPNREDMQIGETGVSLLTLVQSSRPLENYMQQRQSNGLSSCILQQVNGENERLMSDEGFLASVGWGRDQEPNLD
ncbi:hypothetical protein Patl1_35036 [Pistacia atlantica]|uniref:Uncharacterized protein n=1 Tax=Pistacia atlantica TaxID=434234 RepID=A0ACC0ZTH3_9ROSI|nr:hypothetical protein Patl1_35036 [Pistacia atlantica]